MVRKRLRHRVASDIEEDDVMQDETVKTQEDEEIEVKPQTQKKDKGKGKEKASEKRKRVEEDQSDEQDEDEGTEDESDDNAARVDVTNFKDQPLGRIEGQKLHGFATDWKEMDKRIQQSWTGVRQVGVALAGTAEDEDEKSLQELDEIMRELIDVSAEMNAHEQSLNEIHQLIGRGDAISDTMDRYQDAVKAKAREYSQKTTRQKYAKNESYVKFKEGIYEVLHPDMPMRPITELIPREDGDASDDEDDLEVGGVTQDFKCPLTLVPFVDPVTSNVCRHSFSGEAVRAYFEGSRGVKKCPASGCTKSFRLLDCQPDRELANKVKIWARRNKQREEELSDAAEEVIE